MSKGIKELREDLKKMEDKVRQALPDIAILLTLSAKAISERTIKDKGFGYAYSNNLIPAWFLEGKEYSGAGEKFIKQKIKDHEETNWKGLRQAQGMETAFVDLTFSGSMWSNMQPGPVQQNGDIISAPLAATNREAQNKMNYNRARYGDFVGKGLTASDFKTLVDIVVNELFKTINEIF